MTKAIIVEADSHTSCELDPLALAKGRFEILEKSREEDVYLENVQGYKVYSRPYPAHVLASRHEISTELGPCLDVIAENTVGFGYRLITKPELGRVIPTNLKSTIRNEHALLESRLKKLNPKKGLLKILKMLVIDKETDGNNFCEILRNPLGEIVGLDHLPTSKMIVGKSLRPVNKTWKFYDPVYNGDVISDYQLAERIVKNEDFNVFFYVSGQKKTLFKEFGDPRKYRGSTEVIWDKIYRNGSIYGLPRYIGALLPMEGGRKAEEVNFTTFSNNCVPAMAILVSGGKVSDGTIDRIKDYLRSIKESSNYAKVLIIEAETSDEWFQTQQQSKVALQSLVESQRDDALFQAYQANVASRILQQFRMPSLFLGVTKDLNRATAQAARQLADEQVFDPERRNIEYMFNNLLFPEMGVKYHQFKLNSPSITDNQAIATIVSQLEKTGGVTPRIARWALETIFNREFTMEEMENFDFDKPFTAQLAEISTSSHAANDINNPGKTGR